MFQDTNFAAWECALELVRPPAVMHYAVDRMFAWMTHEPLVGVMMVVATIVLFIGAYRRRGADRAEGLWPWTRRTLEAAATALLFLAMLWGFRAVLGDNARTFAAGHGRVTEANFRSVKTIWGEPHVQRELRASLTPVQAQDNPDEDSEPVVHDDVIDSFDGRVFMQLNERQKGSALYNGFGAEIRLRYGVRNPEPNTPMVASLRLPLAGQQLLDDVRVEVDGALVDEPSFDSNGVGWTVEMRGGQRIEVEVTYHTRGVEYLYYQVPTRRQLRNFELELVVAGLGLDDVNYPNNCLAPQSVEATDSGDGVRLRWSLDRAVTTAGMGVALPQPEQPGAEVALVLDRSPYALMLLVVAVGLTLMVRQTSVSFLNLALLCAGYCVVFLTMAAASDYVLGFWGSMAVGAALALALCGWLYRRHPDRVAIAVLVGFFVTVFPLAGLFSDHREAFDGVVSVGLIVYLFVIALRRRPEPEVPVALDEQLTTQPE